VVHHPWPDAEGIYLAADHITFPSTWEGFGNPPLEAAQHRRTVSVGDYPVAAELRRFGFDWFSPGEVDAIREALDHPDAPAAAARLDRNQRIARESFSLEHMAARIGYSCFAVAVVLFVIAFITQFPSWLVTVIIAAMVVGSLVLAPSIVFAYGVKAADAEDRGEKFGY
jgi:hypothetical protein